MARDIPLERTRNIGIMARNNQALSSMLSQLAAGRPAARPRRVSHPQRFRRPEKIRIQKWYTIFKDHITLEDYEIHDCMGLELYYN